MRWKHVNHLCRGLAKRTLLWSIRTYWYHPSYAIVKVQRVFLWVPAEAPLYFDYQSVVYLDLQPNTNWTHMGAPWERPFEPLNHEWLVKLMNFNSKGLVHFMLVCDCLSLCKSQYYVKNILPLLKYSFVYSWPYLPILG